MTAETHAIEPENVMAYLDGELPPDEAARVARHLDQCTTCAELAADLRGVSSRMLAWNIEPAPRRLSDAALKELNDRKKQNAVGSAKQNQLRTSGWKGFLRSRWVWAGAGIAAAALCVLFVGLQRESKMASAQFALRDLAGSLPEVSDKAERGRISSALENDKNPDQISNRYEVTVQPETPPPAPAEAPVPTGPMIARTASLNITAKDFEAARASMDRVVRARQGYVSSLTVSAEQGAARSLHAKLAVPAAQFDATLADLRALGRVAQEQQASEEVTSQVVDLDARLKNARETETQLAEILRSRTGKVGDVLEVEREMARVRGEIESMDAEQKQLRNRVAFASIELNLSEEYQERLGDAPDSVSRRIRNALVDGYHAAAAGLLAACIFLLSVGPSLLILAAVLFWPARWGWRRWRAHRSEAAARG